MDYEKAYKEALETARKINNGDGVAAPADWTTCEVIFPVLREDYDERMVNRIIDLIKEIGEDDSYHVYHYDDMLAWLEKQKSIDVLDKEEREFADNVDAFRKEIDAAYQRGYEEGKRQNKCKFSVGDIVKHSLYDGLYYIVKSIDLAGDYELECLNGKSGNNIASATENYLSLWTIKDAKPGDVLTDGDMFVIFKSNNYDPNTQYGCMFVYCSIMKNNGGWHEFWYESGGINPTYYLPATKEQQELLFQKMKESGYMWDAENRQLKKIEQKTAEWSDDFEEEMDRYIEENFYGSADNGFFSNRTKRELEAEDVVRIGCHFAAWQKEQSNKELSDKSKQEWSEEDERIRIETIELLETANHPNKMHSNGKPLDFTENINWLKSLKDRYTWKPSKEQMKVLQEAVNGNINTNSDALWHLYHDLKKL